MPSYQNMISVIVGIMFFSSIVKSIVLAIHAHVHVFCMHNRMYNIHKYTKIALDISLSNIDISRANKLSTF